MVEFITNAKRIEEINIGKDLPKCVCGSSFKVHNLYSSRGLWGTTADCINCKEHFFGYNYETLRKYMPTAQKMREDERKTKRNA